MERALARFYSPEGTPEYRITRNRRQNQSGKPKRGMFERCYRVEANIGTRHAVTWRKLKEFGTRAAAIAYVAACYDTSEDV